MQCSGRWPQWQHASTWDATGSDPLCGFKPPDSPLCVVSALLYPSGDLRCVHISAHSFRFRAPFVSQPCTTFRTEPFNLTSQSDMGRQFYLSVGSGPYDLAEAWTRCRGTLCDPPSITSTRKQCNQVKRCFSSTAKLMPSQIRVCHQVKDMPTRH